MFKKQKQDETDPEDTLDRQRKRMSYLANRLRLTTSARGNLTRKIEDSLPSQTHLLTLHHMT
jgi:hypothetical protein